MDKGSLVLPCYSCTHISSPTSHHGSLATTSLFSISIILSLQECYINTIRACDLLDLTFSLKVSPGRFPSRGIIIHTFLLPSSVPWCRVPYALTTHVFRGILLVSIVFLIRVVNSWLLMCWATLSWTFHIL